MQAQAGEDTIFQKQRQQMDPDLNNIFETSRKEAFATRLNNLSKQFPKATVFGKKLIVWDLLLALGLKIDNADLETSSLVSITNTLYSLYDQGILGKELFYGTFKQLNLFSLIEKSSVQNAIIIALLESAEENNLEDFMLSLLDSTNDQTILQNRITVIIDYARNYESLAIAVVFFKNITLSKNKHLIILGLFKYLNETNDRTAINIAVNILLSNSNSEEFDLTVAAILKYIEDERDIRTLGSVYKTYRGIKVNNALTTNSSLNLPRFHLVDHLYDLLFEVDLFKVAKWMSEKDGDAIEGLLFLRLSFDPTWSDENIYFLLSAIESAKNRDYAVNIAKEILRLPLRGNNYLINGFINGNPELIESKEMINI